MKRIPSIPPRTDHWISLDQLKLEPLTILHAKELFPVLSDPLLYQYTGGNPPASEEALVQIYSRRVKQSSPDGKQVWLNWMIREQDSGTAIGYVQATVEAEQTLIAWLIGVRWQSRGYASEAALGLVVWLKNFRFSKIRARIHPGHRASQKVAEQAGLAFSGEHFAGEEVWEQT